MAIPSTIKIFDVRVSPEFPRNMLLIPDTFKSANKAVLLLRGSEADSFNSGEVANIALLKKAFSDDHYSSTKSLMAKNTTFELLNDIIDWAEFQRVESMIIYYCGRDFYHPKYEANLGTKQKRSKFPCVIMKDGPACLEKIYKYCRGKFKLLVVGADTCNKVNFVFNLHYFPPLNHLNKGGHKLLC